MSSGSPVMRPRAKLSTRARGGVGGVDRGASTLSASAGSTGTLRSRASSRKLLARSASLAASAASISRDGNAGVERARERAVGQRHRIVLRREQRVGLEARAAPARARQSPAATASAERHGDPRTGHASASRPVVRPQRSCTIAPGIDFESLDDHGAATTPPHVGRSALRCNSRFSGDGALGKAGSCTLWCAAHPARGFEQSMADTDRSPFPQRPAASPVIEIGAREFKCVGATAAVRPSARLPRHGRRRPRSSAPIARRSTATIPRSIRTRRGRRTAR